MPDGPAVPDDPAVPDGPAGATAPDDGLLVIGLTGIGEVTAGSDLAGALLDAVRRRGQRLRAGDVLVVSSKVLSKAAGLSAPAADRVRVLTEQTVRLVASRRTPRGEAQIVQSAAGPVLAAAGVDASNTPPGTLLVLPGDPDAAAGALRGALRAAGAPMVAVVVSDTSGRPWRTGQTDFALGVAGLLPVDDLRGTADGGGQVLEVTERAVADEVAAAADLVKGKAAGIPAALVRGLRAHVVDDDGPGAASLLRPASADWFRLGHVEAVRAALGVPLAGAGAAPAPSVLAEAPLVRVARAVQLARHGSAELAAATVHVEPQGEHTQLRLQAPAFWCGVLAQRLLAALWAEDLAAVLSPPADPSAPGPGSSAVITVRG